MTDFTQQPNLLPEDDPNDVLYGMKRSVFATWQTETHQLSRDLIKYAFAQIERAPLIPLYSEDKSKGKRIHIEWLNNLPLLVHFQNIPGLFPKDFHPFFGDLVGNLNEVSPSVAKYTQVEHDSTLLTFLTSVDFSIPFISGRSVMVWGQGFDQGEDLLIIMTTKEN
jgi:hypothetical protein